jgi:hypothetical protein
MDIETPKEGGCEALARTDHVLTAASGRNRVGVVKKKLAAAGVLPRRKRKLIAQSVGARGKSTRATKNFNQ